MKNFQIRIAEEKDTALILDFIRQLAVYEKMLDEVVTTEEELRTNLFQRKHAEIIIGEYNGEPVAFALYFHNFSTFLGKPGLYLEDLFVKPEMRGMGFGKVMLAYLANLAVKRNCGRMEWNVLRWNKPAIDFYAKQGAVPMDGWCTYRLANNALNEMAKK